MADLGYKEYVVRKDSPALAAALVAVYVFVGALLALAIVWYMVLPLALPAAAAVALLIYFTRPLAKVEYEYVTDGDCITFAVIRGRGARREVLTVPFKSFSAVVPASDDAARRGAQRVYDFRSSPGVPYGYCGVFTDNAGVRSVVFFDGYRQIIDLCFFRNAPATRQRDDLPLYE